MIDSNKALNLTKQLREHLHAWQTPGFGYGVS